MAPVHVTGQVLRVILVMTTKGRLNALVSMPLCVERLSLQVVIN